MSEVTVCITHHNRLEKLERCLDRLEQHTSVPYDIVIHNNGYIDEEIRAYLDARREEGVEVIHTDENLGSAGSRGMLMDREFDTDFVSLIDDDIYVDSGWFDEVKAIVSEHENVGAVAFPFRLPNEASIVDGGKSIEIERGVLRRTAVDYDSIVPSPGSVRVDDTPIGTTCYRSEALEDVKFDKSYRTGFGDLDCSLKAYESPWEVRMCTSTVFVHDKRNVQEKNLKKRRDLNAMNTSYRYFTEKWGVRLPLLEHLYFRYVFAVPNPLLWRVSRAKRLIGI